MRNPLLSLSFSSPPGRLGPGRPRRAAAGGGPPRAGRGAAPAAPEREADWGELSTSGGALPTKWVTNDGVIPFKGRTFKEVLQEIAARPDKEAGSMFCKPCMRLGGTKPGVVGRCEVTVTCPDAPRAGRTATAPAPRRRPSGTASRAP
ncbi:MAG: hypothetical protein R3F43_30280 [bacterium]